MTMTARIATLILAALAPLIVSATGHAAPAGPVAQTLIRNVRVWDGRAENAVAGQDVLVEGKLIRRIGAGLEAGEGVAVIDGGGEFLMPGIIDAHAHLALPVAAAKIRDAHPGYVGALSVRAAEIYLMRGWTTVRDIGGPSQGLKQAVDEGVVPGPRIYSSAVFISQTSGHGDFRRPNEPHPNISGNHDALAAQYTLLADGPDEVRRAAREALRRGATALKLMAGGGVSSAYDPLDTVQYSVGELRAAVEAAAQWNTYVAVHAYTDRAVNNALDAGVRVIEHGHLLTEPTLRRLKKEGAWLSSQSFGFVRQFMRPDDAGRSGKGAAVVEGADTLMTMAKKLGIPVAFGTDTFGSLRAYRAGASEFGFRTRWFTSAEILRQATSINAGLLALTGPRNPYPDGPLGVIAPGAYADLLIVAGDPLADITVLEDHETNIRLIMKDGRIYKNAL